MEKQPIILLTDDSEIHVDPDIYERLGHFTWYALMDGTARRITDDGYQLLHREIMGNPEGLFVGFLDEDRTNCRRENLFSFPPGRGRLVRRQVLTERKGPRSTAAHKPCALPLVDGGEVLIDAEFCERFKDRVWRRFNGHVYTLLPDCQQMFLHREIMGNPKGLYVGFLDRDKLNCQRSNLFSFIPGEKEETWKRILAERSSLTEDASTK